MGQVLSVLAAIVFFVVVYTVGVRMMASFSRAQPPPPPIGELRKVKMTFQCSVCGTEVRMTRAPIDEPTGPSCCMQEMDLTSRSDV